MDVYAICTPDYRVIEENISPERALELAEKMPFSIIQEWHITGWQDIWNGQIEFEGVNPLS